jgi:hypothetical protein
MPRPPLLPIPDRQAIFEKGLDYEAWLAAAENPESAERMRGIRETVTVDDATLTALRAIDRPVNVIAIAEAWCGDVVRHTPVLMRLAEENPLIRVRFITRMDDLDFFVRFLTNGGEAIPKYVVCAANFNEVGHWGPMSSTPRLAIAKGKACGDGGAARQVVGAFYESDGNRETIAELLELFQTASFGGF